MAGWNWCIGSPNRRPGQAVQWFRRPLPENLNAGTASADAVALALPIFKGFRQAQAERLN
ncbi:MAG: hypothetical protein ACOYNF_15180, partial [Rhodoferax sp.]